MYSNSSCNGDDGQGRSAISSLTPALPLYSSIESAQFSIDDIDDVGHYSRHYCPPGINSDSDRVSVSSSSSSSDAADYVSRSRHLVEIARPGNPNPVVPPSHSLSATTRSRSNQDSASLFQSLMLNHDDDGNIATTRPPSKIYLPEDIQILCPHQQKPSNSHVDQSQVQISIAEYELYNLLQSEIASLQSQHQDVQHSLEGIDKKTQVQRSELIRTLATCRGDAKDASFVSAVEVLEQLRAERSKLDCSSKEVTRLLKRRRDKLEELCTRHSSSSPLPLHLDTTPAAADESAVRQNVPKLEGQWFTLTKPTYLDCLGFNDDGNPMYTLGRMSFEMFRPGNLVLSIEAVFNPIMEVVGGDDQEDVMFSVPKTLQEDVRRIMEDGKSDDGHKPVLMTYHIVTAFTIEPHSPSFGPSSPNLLVQTPIRGIMTTQGYALSDPTNPDRMSVWFSGGKMECGESRHSSKFKVWKRIFGDSTSGSKSSKKKKQKPRRTFREGVMVNAARLLMGAEGYNDGMDEESGEMSYSFSRPVGGHGKAYVDILHLDDHHRVMRGHAGTLYVFARVGGKKFR